MLVSGSARADEGSGFNLGWQDQGAGSLELVVQDRLNEVLARALNSIA